MTQGIIVGSDISQEWLLPWWWENYRRHNAHPVAFFDFGLSPSKKQWCQDRGQLIKLPIADIFIKDREEVPLAEIWESRYGETFWNSRKAWFKKPLACLQSPFQKTIWLDLDCEVLGPLDFLFQACNHPSGLAIAKDQTAPTYNSGVIAFRQHNPIIQKWADQSLQKTDLFRGDQDLLSQIIDRPICELPQIYNWNIGYGMNDDAVICHWLGDMAKMALKNQLILSDL
jgi:hypothetical protein